MLICGRFLTTNFTNRTNHCFVESRWICVSPWSKGAEKFCEISHPLKQKPWDPRDLCEPLEQRSGKILWDFPLTKAKTVRSARSVSALGTNERKNSVRFSHPPMQKLWDPRELCEAQNFVWEFRVMWGKIGNLVQKINTDKYETETFIIDDGCYCCSRFCAITDCLS